MRKLSQHSPRCPYLRLLQLRPPLPVQRSGTVFEVGPEDGSFLLRVINASLKSCPRSQCSANPANETIDKRPPNNEDLNTIDLISVRAENSAEWGYLHTPSAPLPFFPLPFPPHPPTSSPFPSHSCRSPSLRQRLSLQRARDSSTNRLAHTSAPLQPSPLVSSSVL